MNKIASRDLFWTLLNIILILTVIFGVQVIVARPSFGEPPRTVTVSAEGKIVISPDIATISFSVVTQGKNPEDIEKENTQKMNSAIDFVKSQGIKAEDIKTANYNLYPNYDYGGDGRGVFPPQPPKIIGYTLTQTVFVKVRDLTKVARVLGGLPSKGINQIDSLNFDVEDQDEFLAEARKEAFRKAREKVNTMARENGVRVRRVVTFSESLGGYPIPYRLEAKALGGDLAAQPLPTIEPGTQEVTVQVSVTYEIR